MVNTWNGQMIEPDKTGVQAMGDGGTGALRSHPPKPMVIDLKKRDHQPNRLWEETRLTDEQQQRLMDACRKKPFLVRLSKEYRVAAKREDLEPGPWQKANRARKFLVFCDKAEEAIVLVKAIHPYLPLGVVVEKRHQPVKGLVEYRWVHAETREHFGPVTAL